MPDYIETFEDGSAAFVSARVDAWHRLGTTLPNVFSAEDAMKVGLLGGWNVRKVALQAVELNADGFSTIDVPDHYATVRTNPVNQRTDYLGTVGEVYRPIQNEEHCELLNIVAEQSGASFETAGSIKGGRQTFVTMKLPEGMKVGGTDEVDLNIAALNSHDGSRLFTLLVTPVRVVCANTQAAALADHVSKFTIRHTTNYRGKVQLAREALGLTWEYIEAFQAEAERMINETMAVAELERVIDKMWPLPSAHTKQQESNVQKRKLQLVQLFTGSDTNEGIRGTRWGGYQAFTEWADHFAPVRGKADAVQGRAERVALGAADDVKEKAFNLLRVPA